MKSINDIINEGKSSFKIKGKLVPIGSTLVVKNWNDTKSQIILTDKYDGRIYGTNKHNCVLNYSEDDVIEIYPLKQTKNKDARMSPSKIREIKVRIAELEEKIAELQNEMEDDAEVIADMEIGKDSPAARKYTSEIQKHTKEIEKLNAKLGLDPSGLPILSKV